MVRIPLDGKGAATNATESYGVPCVAPWPPRMPRSTVAGLAGQGPRVAAWGLDFFVTFRKFSRLCVSSIARKRGNP